MENVEGEKGLIKGIMTSRFFRLQHEFRVRLGWFWADFVDAVRLCHIPLLRLCYSSRKQLLSLCGTCLQFRHSFVQWREGLRFPMGQPDVFWPVLLVRRRKFELVWAWLKKRTLNPSYYG